MVTLDRNTDPLSVKFPWVYHAWKKNSVIASSTASLSTLLRDIASGYLVYMHIIVNIYRWPLGVLSKGPTKSKATPENSSDIHGKGWRCTLG